MTIETVYSAAKIANIFSGRIGSSHRSSINSSDLAFDWNKTAHFGVKFFNDCGMDVGHTEVRVFYFFEHRLQSILDSPTLLNCDSLRQYPIDTSSKLYQCIFFRDSIAIFISFSFFSSPAQQKQLLDFIV